MKHFSLSALVFILTLLLPTFVSGSAGTLEIPKGSAIVVDGTRSAAEWNDAASTDISIAPDWTIHVYLKHDSENLYFDFEGVMHDGKRLFPEILLDPRQLKSLAWQPGQWWLHVSNNLCEGNGEPNVYEKNGVFQCAHQKAGWSGNNPPTAETQTIEVSVSFAKLGLKYSPGMKIGLALDITDATGRSDQKWLYWPADATINSPKTWAVATLE